MSSPIGENQKVQDLSQTSSVTQAKKEIAIDVIHRLFPDMTDFPMTEEVAYKYITWSAVPYLLKPIFSESALNKAKERHKCDQEHINSFMSLLADLWLVLEPEERLLPKNELIDKLFEKYRDIYVNEVGEELQVFLDKEFGDHSNGTLAKKIYTAALPILMKDVSNHISAARSIYPRIYIEDFLNERSQNTQSS